MDTELKIMLNQFGILDEEIDELVNICPGLEFVDYSKARECVIAVIKAGFPQEDISSIIYVNPSFMMYEPVDLKIKLEEIGDKIEQKLKGNPFIL